MSLLADLRVEDVASIILKIENISLIEDLGAEDVATRRFKSGRCRC